jgi:hypothetical protein
MKIMSWLLAICPVFASTACKDNGTGTINPVHRTGTLVGLSLLLDQNAEPGLAGITASINEVSAKGINLFGMAPEWPELEPAPNTYSFHDPIINPLTFTDPDQTKFKSYILVLKMIDSNRKTVPADLSGRSFNDPLVIARFTSLLDTLSKLPSIGRISHILIGNEVDGYLITHPDELNAFAVFLQAAVTHLHAILPSVKAGTIVTFNAAKNNPAIFNNLEPYGDFIAYTYYPTDDSNPNWQMRPPTDVSTDIALMAERAGNKSFAFTEIGYTSSAVNHSSEGLQKQFVDNMFDALRPYKDRGKLAFLFYHGLYDYPTGICGPYALSQGIDSTHLCGFMDHLGLKDFATGKPKQAWGVFTSQLSNW